MSETELRMGAEDFGYYAQQIPACFYRLGTMNAAKALLPEFIHLHLTLMKMPLKSGWE